MSITNQIIIEAVDGKAKKLKPLLDAMVKTVIAEKGCQKYELYQLEEDRDIFFIIEVWKSVKRYEAHLQNEHFKSIMDKMSPLIEVKVSNPLRSGPSGSGRKAKNREV